jgi:flavin-dependent dehydrogenase
MTLFAPRRIDVAVLGGGLAGMATALHLVRRGLEVVCIEPKSWPRETVGESLEFSAPRLLHELGIDCARCDELTHPKSAVRIVGGEDQFTVWPPPFFGRAPIWCSRRTYHADRRELDRRVMELAVAEGVKVVAARVSCVSHRGSTITGVSLDDGSRVEASCYVDASGHNARLFGRALHLDRELCGARRWAFWARVTASATGEETILHFLDSNATELCWMWEIPLNDHEVSVGLVLGEAELRRQRGLGRVPRQILEHHLEGLGGHVGPDSGDSPLQVCSTSYVPFRYREPTGPNWILVGDASAMVDPLTSNGASSALRHAALAGEIVSRALPDRQVSPRDAARYSASAPAVVEVLNRAIGSFLYEPAIRRRLGLRAAVNLYAATGVITNALYAKVRPSTNARSASVSVLLVVARFWIGCARRVASRVPSRRPRRSTPGPRRGC